MGRKKRWNEDMQARFSEGTFERIANVLKPTEDRTGFVRTAVENELKRRESLTSREKTDALRVRDASRGNSRANKVVAMSKYAPLNSYLSRERLSEVTLSFAQIEDMIGAALPQSATRPQWWENATDPNTSHTQCKAWLNAGYNAFLIAGYNKVRFSRNAKR